MSQKEILQLGSYNVERDSDLVGIKVWALHYGTDIILFDYLGQDPKAERYFFKSRPKQRAKNVKQGWILDQPYELLNTKSFHPFLLDMDQIFGRG